MLVEVFGGPCDGQVLDLYGVLPERLELPVIVTPVAELETRPHDIHLHPTDVLVASYWLVHRRGGLDHRYPVYVAAAGDYVRFMQEGSA